MSSITLLPCLLLLCTMSWIPCYHVLHYPVTMSYITLLLCLTLPCLIKECKTTKKSWQANYPKEPYPLKTINLSTRLLVYSVYLVSHYPVSIKECKTTKKSWQVNYPKEPYSSKQLTCQLVYLFTRLLKRLVYLKFPKPFIISSSRTQQA